MTINLPASYIPKNREELFLLSSYQIPLVYCDLNRQLFYFQNSKIVEGILSGEIEHEDVRYYSSDNDYKETYSGICLQYLITIYCAQKAHSIFNDLSLQPKREYQKNINCNSYVEKIGPHIERHNISYRGNQSMGLKIEFSAPQIIDINSL